jgi:eukaryotic-like serine/threonine-protein kinase
MTHPQKLGKYDIRRELGAGAMGVVYEGFDPFIERVVAIKTIRPDVHAGAQSAEVLARFKREAQAAGRLNHPNIVGIYEYGEDVDEKGAKIAFIAMEFIKGKELQDYFDGGQRFQTHDIVRVMGELLDALGHAHANGVVHRDMKPANVIILEGGKVKVADFGIARIESSELTQAGTVMGTPSYMSPEQFLGTTVDARSDLFSVGVILYQFLTGEKPFTGAVTTIMHKVLKEEPLAPSELNATLPPSWDAVIKKSMAKSPDLRYRSAAEFLQAVKDAAAGKLPAADATMINLGGAEATMLNASAEATLVSAAPAVPAAAKAMGLNTYLNNLPGGQPQPPQAVEPIQVASVPVAAPKGPSNGNLQGDSSGIPMDRASSSGGSSKAPLYAGLAAVVLAVGAGGYLLAGKKEPAPVAAVSAPAVVAAPVAAAPVAAQPAAVVPTTAPEPAGEPGMLTISALGLVDPKDPKYGGDVGKAQNDLRADAKRQLVDKVLALMVQNESLNQNYGMVEAKLMPRAAEFVKATLSEGAPEIGKDGLMSLSTRATVNVRAVQKSLNEMSRDERVEFIRQNGDPKISVIINVRDESGRPLERSQLVENSVKERIKSFGFRVWTEDPNLTKDAPKDKAKTADFHILGEIKTRGVNVTLPASGLTFKQTSLSSWTLKTTDRATGEEIYATTQIPAGKNWNGEDKALADIGQMIGESFSKAFFLQHFQVGAQKVSLNVTGLPDADAAKALLKELRGMRAVLDAQMLAPGQYSINLSEGSAPDLVAEGVLKPLNTKLGAACFNMAGVQGGSLTVNFVASCKDQAAKMDNLAPAGLLTAPEGRGKALLRGAKST